MIDSWPVYEKTPGVVPNMFGRFVKQTVEYVLHVQFVFN